MNIRVQFDKPSVQFNHEMEWPSHAPRVGDSVQLNEFLDLPDLFGKVTAVCWFGPVYVRVVLK